MLTVSVSKTGASWESPHGRPLPKPGGRTLIMGILNVTPDSFSDGNQLPTPQALQDRVGRMIAEGADMLDIGGESTRPGATAVTAEEELNRVLPAIEAVRKIAPDVPVSVDTYKATVAAAAIRAGADIVNDVWGLTFDLPAHARAEDLASLDQAKTGASGTPMRPTPMAECVAALRCPVILMHNRRDRDYRDFWRDFLADMKLSLALAGSAGIARHQIWLDPGFGFAKDVPQNLAVVRDLSRMTTLGYPVLLGTSRKSTIGRVLDAVVDDRLDGTGATIVWGIQQGCSMVRVHDVAEMRRYVLMADALKRGLDYSP
jgi:dihydropteroate synthase